MRIQGKPHRLKKRLSSAAAIAAALLLIGSGAAIAATDDDTPLALANVCPPTGHALSGVYHPGRLRLLDACASASGTVVRVKHEVDGDVHLVVKPDPSSQPLLDTGNRVNAGGNLVTELMPRDAGHIAAPQVGDQIRVVGAWSHDRWHNWNEIHPVWALSTAGGPWQVSGPQNGGAPSAASPYAAAADCRTGSGSSCRRY
jgi:hypothetical protein